eukprot:253776_1
MNCAINDHTVLQYMIKEYLTKTKKDWSKKHKDNRKVTDYEYNKKLQYIHIDEPDKNDKNYDCEMETWCNIVTMNDVHFNKVRVCNAKQLLELLISIHPEYVQPVWNQSYWKHDDSIKYFNSKENMGQPKTDQEREDILNNMIEIMDTFGVNYALRFKDDIKRFEKQLEDEEYNYKQDDEQKGKQQELNNKIFTCLCYILFFNVVVGSISKDAGNQDDNDKMMYLYQAHSTTNWLHRHDAAYKWMYLFCCKNANDTLSKLFVSFNDYYD